MGAAVESTAEDINQLNALLDHIALADVPPRVVHQAKRAVLDAVCAMLLGAGETDVPDVERFLQAAGEPTGESLVVGRKARRGFLAAAFANAALCQVHDANDGFAPDGSRGRLLHPGRIVVPAALAIAEHCGLSGRAFLELVLRGYEIAWRVKGLPNADSRSAYIPGLLLSRSLGLSKEETLNAVALAFYHAPAFYRGEYTGKGLDDFALAQGRAVRVGLESALLSANGFRSPSIDGHNGRQVAVDLDASFARYAVEELYFKPYPACRSVHGAAEAAARIGCTNGFDYRTIKSVTVELADRAMYTAIPITMESVDRITAAANPRYVTACALIDGRMRLERFRNDRLRDPVVFEIVSRIDVSENDNFSKRFGIEGRPTRVTVRLADGRTFTEEETHSKGAPANPLSDEELAEKLRRYSPQTFSSAAQADLLKALDHLEYAASLDEITRILRFEARGKRHQST